MRGLDFSIANEYVQSVNLIGRRIRKEVSGFNTGSGTALNNFNSFFDISICGLDPNAAMGSDSMNIDTPHAVKDTARRSEQHALLHMPRSTPFMLRPIRIRSLTCCRSTPDRSCFCCWHSWPGSPNAGCRARSIPSSARNYSMHQRKRNQPPQSGCTIHHHPLSIRRNT